MKKKNTELLCIIFLKTFRRDLVECGCDGNEEEEEPPPPQWSGRN